MQNWCHSGGLGGEAEESQGGELIRETPEL
jgi:hypothetical protein